MRRVRIALSDRLKTRNQALQLAIYDPHHAINLFALPRRCFSMVRRVDISLPWLRPSPGFTPGLRFLKVLELTPRFPFERGIWLVYRDLSLLLPIGPVGPLGQRELPGKLATSSMPSVHVVWLDLLFQHVKCRRRRLDARYIIASRIAVLRRFDRPAFVRGVELY